MEAYGLDNTADADTNLSIDTVAGDDDINNVESSSVDVTIDNVDADAATIVVTLSDGNVAHDKVVTLNGDGSSAYTANFINVGDMDEGALTVSAVVTDDAGNQADVEKDDITLDTIADTGADLVPALSTTGVTTIRSGLSTTTRPRRERYSSPAS